MESLLEIQYDLRVANVAVFCYISHSLNFFLSSQFLAYVTWHESSFYT